jgi:hypothetical protein
VGLEPTTAELNVVPPAFAADGFSLTQSLCQRFLIRRKLFYRKEIKILFAILAFWRGNDYHGIIENRINNL